MKNDDRFVWIPVLALIVGFGIPVMFADFPEDSWQERIWFAIFISMAIFSYAVFKKIGNKYPRLRKWAVNTLSGATITLFLSSLLASSLAIVLAILPLPVWLHFVFAFVLGIFALCHMVRESNAG